MTAEPWLPVQVDLEEHPTPVVPDRFKAPLLVRERDCLPEWADPGNQHDIARNLKW